MLTKITHITLFVHDQDDALDFYQSLGFTIHTDAHYGSMRWLTLNFPVQKEMELILMKAETDDEKSLVGRQAGSKPFISLASTNCAEDVEALKELGIEIIEEPTEHPWGISALFKDLYGNIIYLVEPV